MFRICVLTLALIAQDCWSQDEEGPYRGKFIGKINSYHHQVSGDVYAVDDWTLLLVNFNYDGTGEDAFFWAGDSGRPGPQGFIVPDQHGKTNILERYYNDEVRLTLPDGKRLSRLKWVAVYDLSTQNAFGDVYIPDEFEPPAPVTLAPLAGSDAVSSGPVAILDATTILLPSFRYDGSGSEVYFWVGVGPQPGPRGDKLPDDYGYLEPLRAYSGHTDVRLTVRSLRRVTWLAVWDVGGEGEGGGRALAALLLPERANVPPGLGGGGVSVSSSLPSCRQLHRDLQVSWEVFGSQITVQLAGQIGLNEYMSFGISGEQTRAQMLAADVAVVSYDGTLRSGRATDYNVTELAPCVQVLGEWRGVCRDAAVGGQDSTQVLSAQRADGLTLVRYRRAKDAAETMDRPWTTDRLVSVVWAVGALDAVGEPGYHRLYPRGRVMLNLTAGPHENDCVPFDLSPPPPPPPWETAQLFDPALRVFRVSVGPGGGARGVGGRARGGAGGAYPDRALYVNGQLAPDLQLRRGLHYTFQVFGGNDPHSARDYHPLVITVEAAGGLERLGEGAQRAARVLAGVRITRRGRLEPTAAGPLCLGAHPSSSDRRRAASHDTFRSFNRSLGWSCAPGPPALLHVTPNSSWPDLVYYNSFTHRDMGGRIFIVDRHKRSAGRSAGGRAAAPLAAPLVATLALGAMGLATLLDAHRLDYHI